MACKTCGAAKKKAIIQQIKKAKLLPTKGQKLKKVEHEGKIYYVVNG